MRHLFVATIAFACVSAPAFAHTRGHHQHHSSQSSHHGRHYASARHGGGAWCGAYMRQVFGIADPTLNLARNWARVGSNAGGPRLGAVVVWPHHVGVIRGDPNSSGEYLVESGNDGHAVRTRYRSLRGAIAFRSVGGGSGLAFQEQDYAPRRAQQQRYARRPDTQNFDRAGYNNASMDERSGYLRVAQNWTGRDRRMH